MKSASWFYRFIRRFTALLFKFLYRHKVYGLEHYISAPAILAANHVSYLDPPVVGISSPEEIHFLARDSLFKNPLFCRLITSLNSHPVSGGAGDVAVFKTIISLLQEGKQVVLFPEGARSFDNRLTEIKPGIGMLALRANAAIIPIYIAGTFNVWGRLRRVPKLHGKTACVFGTPIYASAFAQLDKKEAQKAIAEQLAQAIENLRAWYESGAKGSPP